MRFYIASFLLALEDRNTTFHIKEKDSKTLHEACDIYERYQALLNDSHIDASRRKSTVKVITSPEDTESSAVIHKVIMDLTSRISQLTDLVHRPVPPSRLTSRLLLQRWHRLPQPAVKRRRALFHAARSAGTGPRTAHEENTTNRAPKDASSAEKAIISGGSFPA